MSDQSPEQKPPITLSSDVDEILKLWVDLTHDEFDGTILLDDLLAHISEAKVKINNLLAEAYQRGLARADSSKHSDSSQPVATKPVTQVQELEDFLRKFLFEMALEATDGHTRIETLDYVSEEHLFGWAEQLAEMVNKSKGTFTVHGKQYELASYGEPYKDGSRTATIKIANNNPPLQGEKK